MVTKILGLPPLLLAACAVAACGSPAAPGSRDTFTSQGIVAGFVRDTAGRGVAHAVVCASAAFEISGTPVLVTRQVSTNAQGAYLVPFNLDFVTLHADVRAGLTVAATPAALSGLEPGYTSGLTVLITTNPPPAETTYADVAVAKGSPYKGVFCVYGP